MFPYQLRLMSTVIYHIFCSLKLHIVVIKFYRDPPPDKGPAGRPPQSLPALVCGRRRGWWELSKPIGPLQGPTTEGAGPGILPRAHQEHLGGLGEERSPGQRFL